MDKKLFVVLLVLALIVSTESWGRRRRTRRKRRRRFRLRRVWKGVKKVAKKVWRFFKLLKGDGSTDLQTLQELRDLRKQDPDSYLAGMMIVADELLLEMSKDEAEDQLQALDAKIAEEERSVFDDEEKEGDNIRTDRGDVEEVLRSLELDSQDAQNVIA